MDRLMASLIAFNGLYSNQKTSDTPQNYSVEFFDLPKSFYLVLFVWFLVVSSIILLTGETGVNLTNLKDDPISIFEEV